MIEINTQQALIGINTKNAKLLITQPTADIQIRTKKATLEIHTEQVRIRIDQQQCFNESGLMSPMALSEDIAERGMQAAGDAVAKASAEGDQLARIESGGGVIADIAFSNSINIPDYNIVLMPRSKPKIDFVGGTIDIKVEDGYIDTQVQTNKPNIDVEKGSVEIYLRQKAEININYKGDQLDIRV